MKLSYKTKKKIVFTVMVTLILLCGYMIGK